MREFIDIIDTKYFEFDIMYKPWFIGFGLSIFNNSKRGGKPCNICVEVEFLCWIIGMEIKWSV